MYGTEVILPAVGRSGWGRGRAGGTALPSATPVPCDGPPGRRAPNVVVYGKVDTATEMLYTLAEHSTEKNGCGFKAVSTYEAQFTATACRGNKK